MKQGTESHSSSGLTLNHQVFQDLIYGSSVNVSALRSSPQAINMKKQDDK
jgi:hypothetical protein